MKIMKQKQIHWSGNLAIKRKINMKIKKSENIKDNMFSLLNINIVKSDALYRVQFRWVHVFIMLNFWRLAYILEFLKIS